MTNYLRNGTSLLTIFNITNPQDGPVTGYLQSGTDIGTKFKLYMHGTREKCFYNITIDNVKYDLGFFFQKDSFSPVQQLGLYNMSPWNITTGATGMNSNTYWIWPTSNANLNAPGSSDGYYYWFYYTFYYNGSQNSGKIYSCCDNYSKIYFNNVFIANNNGGYGGSVVNTNNVTINPGLNYLRISAYNAGYVGSDYIFTGTMTQSNLSNGFRILYFTSDGTITFNSECVCQVLVVGGGGGGGFDGGGGGGAGGVTDKSFTFSAGITYNLFVGGGGGGAQNSTSIGSDGGDSGIKINSSNSWSVWGEGGGGGGSNHVSSRAGNGGSGGGRGATDAPNSSGIAGTASGNGIGHNGGDGDRFSGGGGGGGSGSGGNPHDFFYILNVYAGDGGPGYTWSIDSNIYAGGGAGGSWNVNGGTGGSGGGGNGGTRGAGANATGYGSGGGGGGSSNNDSTKKGGKGSNGIIAIRLQPSNPAGLLVSVVDSNNNNVANTNSNWAYSTSSSFDINPLTFNPIAS